ncbi:MAG: hypothetical protein HRT90_06080 [Candidatus Margulisbacteria bacterium]|nr:hypothetical protein [Candidatus Margulisiibacteriota bacterium]
MKNLLSILIKPKTYIVFVVILSCLTLSCYSQESIFVIKSSTNAPYDAAERGINRTLSNTFQMKVFDIDNDWQLFPEELIKKENPAAIITIGTLATKLAYEHHYDIPLIYTMVLRPDLSGISPAKQKNITGLALDIPFHDQFSTMKKLMPHVTKVGTLYHPSERQRIIKAVRIAKKYNIQLMCREVSQTTDIKSELQKLLETDGIELFWPIMDPKTYSVEALQYILLKTTQRGVPLVGPSFAYLRWGALFSFDIDYVGVGEQTGRLVKKALHQEVLSKKSASSHSHLKYSLNLKAAKQLGIPFQESIIENAGYVSQ